MRQFTIIGCLLISMTGCHQQPPTAVTESKSEAVTVSTVKPERKTLRRVIEQPAQIEAYEETPLVPRVPGYVLEVNGDIGMFFEKDEVLARLSVPELVAEHHQKIALIVQAKAGVKQAE